MKSLTSKRFIVTVAGIILFFLGIFFFKINPVSMAQSLAILLSPYLIFETIKPTTNKLNNDK